MSRGSSTNSSRTPSWRASEWAISASKPTTSSFAFTKAHGTESSSKPTRSLPLSRMAARRAPRGTGGWGAGGGVRSRVTGASGGRGARPPRSSAALAGSGRMRASSARVPRTAPATSSALSEVAREACPPQLDAAGDEAGAEDGHHQSVHGRGHRAEAAVEDAGDHEELKQVRRHAHEVEQERDRRVDAPEDREEPGAPQRRVARGRDLDPGVPPREQDEADGEHLRAVREVEGHRDEHVHELVLALPVRPAVLRPPLGEEGARALHEDGEHDEEVGRDERGEERVLRERDHPLVADRRQRGHEPGQQPEGQQAGEDGVGEHEPLQPLELLELHGAGGVPGDREDPERGEPGEQAPHAAHGLVEHVQGLEERLLAGQRHEAHAGEHGEDDHRRDHVVGEGAEGVGRDVEVEPVDGALGLEARRRRRKRPPSPEGSARGNRNTRPSERPQSATSRRPPRLARRRASSRFMLPKPQSGSRPRRAGR